MDKDADMKKPKAVVPVKTMEAFADKHGRQAPDGKVAGNPSQHLWTKDVSKRPLRAVDTPDREMTVKSRDELRMKK